MFVQNLQDFYKKRFEIAEIGWMTSIANKISKLKRALRFAQRRSTMIYKLGTLRKVDHKSKMSHTQKNCDRKLFLRSQECLPHITGLTNVSSLSDLALVQK